MAENIDWRVESAALKARLAKIAEGRTRSEIARKTGTSPTNVVRYLKGTRMPVEFAVALVRGLGINPAWLLTGEGAPLLADVTAQTADMGRNLLELVEAMNAVSRMKLGALAGKQQARILRELSDALGAHDRLRSKLNAQTREVFAQLLSDLGRCLNDYKVQQAAPLLAAAEQVARLCDDEELHQVMLSHKASYHAFINDLDTAIECRRRLMQRMLGASGAPDEPALRNVVNLVLTLMTRARLAEARRLCEATLKLIRPSTPRYSALALLRFLEGRIMAEMGELLPGLAVMTRELSLGGGPTEPTMRLWLTQHLMRAGLLRPEEALAWGDDSPIKSIVLLDFACFLEDARLLKRACDFASQPRFAKLGDLERPAHAAFFLLRAMQSKDRRAAAEYLKAAPQCVDDMRDWPDVFAAQILRAAGDAALAREAFERAQEKLAALVGELHVSLLTRAIHHRTALWLAARTSRFPSEHARAAEAFFATHAQNGFACFAAMAERTRGRDGLKERSAGGSRSG